MPPPLRSIPSCRMSLVVIDVSDRGRQRRHGGIRGVGVRVVEEDEVGTIAIVHQVPIHPGVDNGGKRSSMMLVGLGGSQRQAEEGGGEGAAP